MIAKQQPTILSSLTDLMKSKNFVFIANEDSREAIKRLSLKCFSQIDWARHVQLYEGFH